MRDKQERKRMESKRHPLPENEEHGEGEGHATNRARFHSEGPRYSSLIRGGQKLPEWEESVTKGGYGTPEVSLEAAGA